MPLPNDVAIWRPRADEHELAASLGMCEPDPERLAELIREGQTETARLMPGVPVRVYRWHVWRLVRAMVRCGVTNTPQGRATAVAWLANNPGEQ